MILLGAEIGRGFLMSIAFVVLGRHPMTDYEHVCTSGDPERVIASARGTYFSSFHISVVGKEKSSDVFSEAGALRGYMDVELGKDTPEARLYAQYLRLVPRQ